MLKEKGIYNWNILQKKRHEIQRTDYRNKRHLVKTPLVSQKAESNYAAPTRRAPNRKTQKKLK